ncbi:MAG: hypothetical protein ACTHN5_07125 [Phycisphaerae bacterium]
MTMEATTSAVPAGNVPATSRTLRRLFLTLFLRGRSARGLKKDAAPKSLGRKLWATLLTYGMMGFLACLFIHKPVFALAVYMHAMTFVFLGMFVAASAGEVLFNKEEADILLHRPIDPKALLWAKVRVLVEVSLWIAGAFNLVTLVVGMFASNGDWRFPLVHAFATTLEALFCTACVVIVYQLCLRWFGRQRLEGLMTTAQVVIAIAAVMTGQLLPQLLIRPNGVQMFTERSWWIALLPPAWFAGLDDALAGSPTIGAGILGLTALLATTLVLLLSFGKLAGDYEAGLQTLNEGQGRLKKSGERRRWLDRLVAVPPLSWWLRDPVERASFLLMAAYMLRDRDVKLRLYPGIAPILVIPLIFMIRGHDAGAPGSGMFGPAFTFAYLGLLPMLALNILQYSQQYQASDIFRAAPIAGPGKIMNGARRAVMLLLTLPVGIAFVGMVWAMSPVAGGFWLALPGVMALPLFSLVPHLLGGSIPLSRPSEEAKSASRGMTVIVAMICALGLAGITMAASALHLLPWLLVGETAVVIPLYVFFRWSIARTAWTSLE